MPMITVRYAPARTGQLTTAVARAANALSAEFLHKDRTVTAVVVEEIDPAKWFISDRSLEEHGLASFWIDVRVVEGTNTREEKAAFLAATFTKMGELLGPLHPESYVHVNEVRGDAYGYGGITQNERYAAAKLDRRPESSTARTIHRKPLLTAVLNSERPTERVEIKEIELAPGQRSGLHRHPCHVVGYIASGSVVYQIEGQPSRVLNAGEAFHEPEQARMLRFDNASATAPARFIAFYLLGSADQQLIEMLAGS